MNWEGIASLQSVKAAVLEPGRRKNFLRVSLDGLGINEWIIETSQFLLKNIKWTLNTCPLQLLDIKRSLPSHCQQWHEGFSRNYIQLWCSWNFQTEKGFKMWKNFSMGAEQKKFFFIRFMTWMLLFPTIQVKQFSSSDFKCYMWDYTRMRKKSFSCS